MIDPVDASIFGYYALGFLALCIAGGVIAWLIPHTLEAIGDFISEGRLR